jgi:hypothetical protein
MGALGGGEGSGRDIHSHEYAVRFVLVSLKYRNIELTRKDYSKYFITRESTILFFSLHVLHFFVK